MLPDVPMSKVREAIGRMDSSDLEGFDEAAQRLREAAQHRNAMVDLAIEAYDRAKTGEDRKRIALAGFQMMHDMAMAEKRVEETLDEVKADLLKLVAGPQRMILALHDSDVVESVFGALLHKGWVPDESSDHMGIEVAVHSSGKIARAVPYDKDADERAYEYQVYILADGRVELDLATALELADIPGATAEQFESQLTSLDEAQERRKRGEDPWTPPELPDTTPSGLGKIEGIDLDFVAEPERPKGRLDFDGNTE